MRVSVWITIFALGCGHAAPKPPPPPTTKPASQPSSSVAVVTPPPPPPPPPPGKPVDRGWGDVPTSVTVDGPPASVLYAASGKLVVRDDCGGFSDKKPPQLLINVKAPVDKLRVLLVPETAGSFNWHVSWYSPDLKDADEDFTGCAISSTVLGLGKKAGVYAIGTLGTDTPVPFTARIYAPGTARDPFKGGKMPAQPCCVTGVPLEQRGLLRAYPEMVPADLDDPAVAKRVLAEAPREMFVFRAVKGGVEPVLLLGDDSAFNVLTPDGMVVSETALTPAPKDKIILPTKARARAIFDDDVPRFARSAKAKALLDAVKDAPARQAELLKLVTDEDTAAREDVLAAAKARKW
jgi:hypothetical protein